MSDRTGTSQGDGMRERAVATFFEARGRYAVRYARGAADRLAVADHGRAGGLGVEREEHAGLLARQVERRVPVRRDRDRVARRADALVDAHRAARARPVDLLGQRRRDDLRRERVRDAVDRSGQALQLAQQSGQQVDRLDLVQTAVLLAFAAWCAQGVKYKCFCHGVLRKFDPPGIGGAWLGGAAGGAVSGIVDQYMSFMPSARFV